MLILILLHYYFAFWVNFIFTKPVTFTAIPILECSPLKENVKALKKYIILQSVVRNL